MVCTFMMHTYACGWLAQTPSLSSRAALAQSCFGSYNHKSIILLVVLCACKYLVYNIHLQSIYYYNTHIIEIYIILDMVACAKIGGWEK